MSETKDDMQQDYDQKRERASFGVVRTLHPVYVWDVIDADDTDDADGDASSCSSSSRSDDDGDCRRKEGRGREGKRRRGKRDDVCVRVEMGRRE